jgi:hypothetical protein
MYDESRGKTRELEQSLLRLTKLKGLDSPDTESVTIDLRHQRGWILHHERYADPDHVQSHLLPPISER